MQFLRHPLRVSDAKSTDHAYWPRGIVIGARGPSAHCGRPVCAPSTLLLVEPVELLAVHHHAFPQKKQKV